jgi:RNA polymerase-binding transcription factor DksA
MNISGTVIIENKTAFDQVVRAVKILETVSSDKCDRCHNKKPHSRTILPIARLCVNCREEIGL